MKVDIQQFREELMHNMTSNIFPYWIDKMVDNENGGFYGQRDAHDNLIADAPKGAILNGRLLWSFAAAYRITRRPEYLEMATRAKRYIIDNFYDREFGGIYWSLTADGQPLDTKKQFYAIGFVIYGLSEYVRATGDEEALEYAIKLFHDIENHSRDRKNGGYIEACTREWGEIEDMRLSAKDANEKKTMNTHLHIIEPYTNLYRVWKNDELKEAISSLLDIFLNIMEEKNHHHLGLFFDENWVRHDREQSFGHDIEASWLLLESALVLNDKDIIAKTLNHTRDIAHAALEGRCVDGSMVYERHASGAYVNDKHWWVQAELVVGLIYLYRFHGEESALEMAYQTWTYIKENIVDNEGGEWFWSRLADGSVNSTNDKAGFWKCPYHNSRMCMEVYSVLGEIAMAPFKFEPYLKSVLWGGERIAQFKGIACDSTDIGESWELSGVPSHLSVVAEGPDKGLNLQDIMEKYTNLLLGNKVYKRYGNTFPLLIKLIDAKRDLSLQVHPDDALAQKRHNCMGKTEMWYIIDTTPEATIYAGLSKKIDADYYCEAVKDGSIMEAVAAHASAPGDLFFLPAGRIHAIGAGNLLAEIQQTSDITYRVYDFGRLDANGNPRELHTELAKDAIDYRVYPSYTSQYTYNEQGVADMVRCQYFDVKGIKVEGEHTIESPSCDSFRVVMCLEGEAQITDCFNNVISIKQGETILVPAVTTSLAITGNAYLLTATA